MPKASQAENKRDSDSIINRLTYHQNIRTSDFQRNNEADINVTERQQRAKEGPYRKSIEKFQKNLPKVWSNCGPIGKSI